MSISKKDLSLKISRKLGLSNKHSLELVNSFLKFIILNSEDRINIHGFGSFFPKVSPKRLGRNPKTMQEFEIQRRIKVSFRSSDQVKKNLN